MSKVVNDGLRDEFNRIYKILGNRVGKAVLKGGAIGGALGGGAGYLSAKQRQHESDKDFKTRKLKRMAAGGAFGAGAGALIQAHRLPHHVAAWDEDLLKKERENSQREREAYEERGRAAKAAYEKAKAAHEKANLNKTGSLFGEKLSDAQKNRLKEWRKEDLSRIPSKEMIQNRLKTDPELAKQHMGGRGAARGALVGALAGGVIGVNQYNRFKPGASTQAGRHNTYFKDPKRTARIGAYGAAIGAALTGGGVYLAQQHRLQKHLDSHEKEEHAKKKTKI